MYSILLALIYLAIGFLYAHPVVVHPTPPNKVDDSTFVITADNTLNATSSYRHATPANANYNPVKLALVNNFGDGVNAYITGRDDNGQLFLVQSDGQLYYPSNPAAGLPPQEVTAPVAIPLGGLGSTTHLNLVSHITAGRIYFAAGELRFYVNNGPQGPSLVEPSAVNPSDPSSAINWGFAELTWNAEQLYANISYVDFVGLAIGIALATVSGGFQQAKGLPAGAAATICDQLRSQKGADGAPWDQLCVVDGGGNVLRVLSPNNILNGPNTAFGSYWNDYIDRVWSHYTDNDLTINSQNGNGDLKGRVNPQSGNLEFSNGGSFQKPNAGDIFGCNSGPFTNAGDLPHLSIVARLCAAFNRGTLLDSNGNDQPNGITDYSKYYISSPNNHYSRVVHRTEVDGKGYAFAYDDVNPDGGADQSGAVHDGQPDTLTLTVGGPS